MATIRRIDPVELEQRTIAMVLARRMVIANQMEGESAELSQLESRREWYKGVLAVATVVLSFTVLAWPILLK
jgi:hypothetical protein